MLRTGPGVLKPDESRTLLRSRFGKSSTGLPRAVRVYAAGVDNYVTGTDFISHHVAVEQDDRVVLDHAGDPIGFGTKTGPITATEAIGIGKIAMLVCREHSTPARGITTGSIWRPPPWTQPNGIHAKPARTRIGTGRSLNATTARTAPRTDHSGRKVCSWGARPPLTLSDPAGHNRTTGRSSRRGR